VIPLLDLTARIQPVHIDDLVGAALALLRQWPTESVVVPLVGPEPMTLARLIDHLRAAQGWAPARYIKAPALLTEMGSRLGDCFGWRALNRQSVALAQRDNLADPEVLASICGYRAAPVQTIWLGTAVVCLGPGYDWGLRIMAEAGVHGAWAKLAVVSGALLDGALGVGMLLQRWRRQALRLQLGLMLGYTLCISFTLPHYWFDPYAAVAKNLVLIVATLWLLWTEPRR
jgi:predicted membrane protein